MTRRKTFRASAAVAVSVLLSSGAHSDSINGATGASSPAGVFTSKAIAEFDMPWALAFLPDGRLLVTEEPGRIFLVGSDGWKIEVGNVPAVATSGGDGLLDIAPAPDFATSSRVYFTYVEPEGGGRLVLSRATLSASATDATLVDPMVIWRQNVAGGGVHTGGVIAFDPQGSHLFLTIGDFRQPDTAQDPAQARGKVLRLALDGAIPVDNPNAGEGGVRAQTWTTGHRNPYGLAFAPDGQLWLHEMGPRGGDELNLIMAGQNYGWPVVSNGDDYSGSPIPDHESRPEFAAPSIHWTPVISPAGLAFYEGAMFPQWRGSALIGGLSAQSLVRVRFGADGQPGAAEQWDMGARIRDVAVASDGAVWVIEDSSPGRLLRLTPADRGAASPDTARTDEAGLRRRTAPAS
jgi:glucose/arabinose dehydrogenase